MRTLIASALLAAMSVRCSSPMRTGDAATSDIAVDSLRADVTEVGSVPDGADALDGALDDSFDVPDSVDVSPDLVVPADCTGRTGATGDFEIHMTFAGADRRFLVHVPTSYRANAATPMVLSFHGFTETPEDSRSVTHFDIVGDQRGWITVFPAGLLGSWNGGVCCGTSQIGNVDDVGFVRAMVAQLSTSYCVDAHRIFAAGFSNGGFLSHRLACEAADVFAAIGVGSGQETMPTCTPSRPVPVIQAHGTSDPVVPYGGNVFLMYPPTATTIDGWVMRNGCTTGPTEVYRNGAAHCDLHSGCTAGADVELCSIDGGLHDWFGGGSAWVDGGAPSGFVESYAFADFFAAHPMP